LSPSFYLLYIQLSLWSYLFLQHFLRMFIIFSSTLKEKIHHNTPQKTPLYLAMDPRLTSTLLFWTNPTTSMKDLIRISRLGPKKIIRALIVSRGPFIRVRSLYIGRFRAKNTNRSFNGLSEIWECVGLRRFRGLSKSSEN